MVGLKSPIEITTQDMGTTSMQYLREMLSYLLVSVAVLVLPIGFAKTAIAQAIQEFPIPSMPLGIATGPDGALWFAEDSAPYKIGRITPAGTITQFPLPFPTLLGARGIAVGSDGALWFTDSATRLGGSRLRGR
jgi:streptogramin lyase